MRDICTMSGSPSNSPGFDLEWRRRDAERKLTRLSLVVKDILALHSKLSEHLRATFYCKYTADCMYMVENL